MQLYLCDTHTQEDFYVHSTLQTEGHALPWAKAEYLEVSALKWVEVSLENLNIYVYMLYRHLIYQVLMIKIHVTLWNRPYLWTFQCQSTNRPQFRMKFQHWCILKWQTLQKAVPTNITAVICHRLQLQQSCLRILVVRAIPKQYRMLHTSPSVQFDRASSRCPTE